MIGSRSRLPNSGLDGRPDPIGKLAGSGPGHRHVVGIGELAVANHATDVIVTHALGSCIAVCLWDPVAGVGGLLHYLLPESKINPARAVNQPATFADTGIPLLLAQAFALGAQKNRLVVRLVGGAEVAGGAGAFNVGKRNLLAARNLLWKQGMMVRGEAVGGTVARTVHMDVGPGRIRVTSGSELLHEF